MPNHVKNEWPSDHSAVISRFSLETNIEVSKSPAAKFFVGTPVIMQGENVGFTDISTNNPTSWSWIFEGGTPAVSSDKNPAITYKGAGNFSVTLISANAQGSDTTTVTGLIIVKPPVNLMK